MAVFQSEIRQGLGFAEPGTIISNHESFKNVINCVNVGNNEAQSVKIGCFVQSFTTSNPKTNTAHECILASGAAITGRILGVAIKDAYINTCEDGVTLRRGDAFKSLNVGNVAIETSTNANDGEYVHLVKSTGALTFKTSEDAVSTKEGETTEETVYTGFRVLEGTNGENVSDSKKAIIVITTANIA